MPLFLKIGGRQTSAILSQRSPIAMLEIKISCACAINRLLNISLQLFRCNFVRIRLQTSTSSFFKFFEKPTVNFGSYRKSFQLGFAVNTYRAAFSRFRHFLSSIKVQLCLDILYFSIKCVQGKNFFAW